MTEQQQHDLRMSRRTINLKGSAQRLRDSLKAKGESSQEHLQPAALASSESQARQVLGLTGQSALEMAEEFGF
jgi:hypothetical protein